MQRICELCGTSKQAIPLHHQPFVLPSDNTLSSYDVVACPQCYFLYATHLNPSHPNYYTDATHHLSAFGLPEGLSKIHHDFINFIEMNCEGLSPQTSILDVGASMGHFLNLFKVRGYNDLTGIEAAQNADLLARSTYGIDVRCQLLDSFISERKYELVTISGVLEHLTELHDKVTRLSNLITANGYLFVAVPDASRFNKNTQAEPFLEFASEHINYFSPNSLHQLLTTHKFGLISCDSIYNSYYGNYQLVAFYKNNSASVTNNSDTISTDLEAMREYIFQCEQRLVSINNRLRRLVTTQSPVVIWGTGQLTARLLAGSELAKLNITRFIDNNRAMQGSTYFGRQITSPNTLSNSCETVIISSVIHHRAIGTEISLLPNFSGDIVSLIED